MKTTDRKAVALVIDGHVTVDVYSIDADGNVTTAMGTVKDYTVGFTPDGVSCTCEHGRHSTRSHSHDTALRLQATMIEERKQDGR